MGVKSTETITRNRRENKVNKIVLMLCILVSGCGYTTGSLLPSNYRTINVDSFRNKIGHLSEDSRELYIPLLENKVRDSIIVRFQNDGHLKVERKDQTDLLLKGDLTRFEREELRIDNDQNVTEYRIRITVNIALYDGVEGVEIWKEGSFAGEATYYLSGPQAKSESVALEDALTDLSRRIVERTLENW